MYLQAVTNDQEVLSKFKHLDTSEVKGIARCAPPAVANLAATASAARDYSAAVPHEEEPHDDLLPGFMQR
jgi:hypothetical protein